MKMFAYFLCLVCIPSLYAAQKPLPTQKQQSFTQKLIPFLPQLPPQQHNAASKQNINPSHNISLTINGHVINMHVNPASVSIYEQFNTPRLANPPINAGRSTKISCKYLCPTI